MSDSVERLKELLFDSENKALANLADRIDRIAGEAATEKSERSEMVKRLDAVFENAGTEERFTSRVAATLDRAMRTAEVERHRELADAMAPLVVHTIRMELRNSHDELVDALYPITGRMVKSYVASAMKDLLDTINRRLESNPVSLRLRSLVTGRPVAELALAESYRLRVKELLLIRRGTGEFAGSWPEASVPNHVMSGVLAAINEFATEALKDDGSSLRRVDLGDEHAYVRASPLHLLVARCTGSSHASVEKIIDDEFLSAMEALQAMPGAGWAGSQADPAINAMLGGVSARLDASLATALKKTRARLFGLSPFALLVLLFGLPLLVWLCWTAYTGYKTDQVRVLASRVLAESNEVRGFPAALDVARGGHTITVSGLAPSEAAKSSLIDRLKAVLPDVDVRGSLTVVGGNSIPDPAPRLAALEEKLRAAETELAAIKAVSPRQALEVFIRKNAIFFGAGTDYRNPDAVKKILDELSGLVGRANVTLRVTGYTDERGGQTRNTSLSQARADKVRNELIERGVAADRLVSVGRLDALDLAPQTGESSPNRRVEFEIGFEGEGKP